MTDKELIARLRKADEYEPLGHDGWEAADRLEALVKQCEGLAQAAMNNGQALILAEARAERLEAALREIANMPDYRLPKPQDIARAALREGGYK